MRACGKAIQFGIAGGMAMLFILLGARQAPSADQSAAEIYAHKCAVCHGADGAGKTAKGKKVKVKDVRATIQKMSEDDMIKVVEKGKGENMDSYQKEFNPGEIKALVEYYRSLAKK